MSEEGLVYFEDLEVGSTASFGRYEVTREEVIEFASKYDPQPFHLSDEAAAQTHFGRISASGWHTCAMTMRMLVDNITERKQNELQIRQLVQQLEVEKKAALQNANTDSLTALANRRHFDEMVRQGHHQEITRARSGGPTRAAGRRTGAAGKRWNMS